MKAFVRGCPDIDMGGPVVGCTGVCVCECVCKCVWVTHTYRLTIRMFSVGGSVCVCTRANASLTMHTCFVKELERVKILPPVPLYLAETSWKEGEKKEISVKVERELISFEAYVWLWEEDLHMRNENRNALLPQSVLNLYVAHYSMQKNTKTQTTQLYIP